MEYRVTWRIDVDADTPEAAARLAREIMRDPQSTATVFDVTPLFDLTSRRPLTTVVDLKDHNPT